MNARHLKPRLSDKSGLPDHLLSLAPSPVSKAIAWRYDLYLDGAIGDASEYIEWFEVLEQASENDTIVMHINSEGGDALTAVQMLHYMNLCRATIMASVEGACMSAATMIFLAASQVSVAENSLFMFHDYSGAAFGKGGEMRAQILGEERWSENLIRSHYTGFMANAEITELLNGKDFWMTRKEVIDRLVARNKRNTKAQAAKQGGRKKTAAPKPAEEAPAVEN